MRIWGALRRSTVIAMPFATADARRCCGERTRHAVVLLHEGALASLGNLQFRANLGLSDRHLQQKIRYAECFFM